MAGSSLLVLIDDIATLLDDVSLMTKVAAKKTAGVLGDDLALNAQQVTGVRADRELPVVWAVAKGSFVNKAILVPAALLISAFIPWAVTPLLMLGGAFLCFEGFEKLAHKFLHSAEEEQAGHAALTEAVAGCSHILVLDETRHSGGVAEALMAHFHETSGAKLARLTAKDSFIATGPAYAATMPGKAGHRRCRIEPIRPAGAGAVGAGCTRSTTLVGAVCWLNRYDSPRLVTKNSVARIAVVRVSALAVPRADMKPDPPPMPRPPPSDRWMRTTPIKATTTMR